MRKELKVFPNAGEDSVTENDDGLIVVRVKAPAKDNKANISLIKLLSRHFGRPVRIVSGLNSKRKVVEIS